MTPRSSRQARRTVWTDLVAGLTRRAVCLARTSHTSILVPDVATTKWLFTFPDTCSGLTAPFAVSLPM
jgi:hypothetical protein